MKTKITQSIELRSCGPLLLAITRDDTRTVNHFDVIGYHAERRSVPRDRPELQLPLTLGNHHE